MVCNVKLGKNMRSVSIVGIGATPFFNGVENPTYKGLTNGELFGHAALDAMKDAGIEPRDVQFFFHGVDDVLFGPFNVKFVHNL